jgi:hydroxymethylglutaryl-CoA lyase
VGSPCVDAATICSLRSNDITEMSNSDDILRQLLRDTPTSPRSVSYSFLTPNMRGLDDAISVINEFGSDGRRVENSRSKFDFKNGNAKSPSPIPEKPSALPVDADSFVDRPQLAFSVFAAATESFSRKNLNCDIATSLERFAPVIQKTKDKGHHVRAYISVVLGCPFEGYNVDPHKVAEIATTLMEMGADEISLGDTTGMGTAPRTRELLKVMAAAGVRSEDLAMHFHDTYGQALVNTLVSLDHGVRTFDSSVGGLGGCPFSPGATGNVASEDMIYFLESVGMRTGVDLEAMATIGDWIRSETIEPNSSSVARAIRNKRKSQKAA